MKQSNDQVPISHERGKDGRKNVVFILVDTLRYDFLGVGGYSPSPSPVIDSLVSNGLSGSNMFTVGCPTDMSMPGLFTSSFPLDEGGYDLGILGRGTSMAEVFQSNGYSTALFHFKYTTYGYERGFTDVYAGNLVSFDITKPIKGRIQTLARHHRTGLRSSDQTIALLITIFTQLFQSLDRFCNWKQDVWATGSSPRSRIADDPDWDIPTIRRLMQVEERQFQANPVSYVQMVLNSNSLPIFSLMERVARRILRNLGLHHQSREVFKSRLVREIMSRHDTVMNKYRPWVKTVNGQLNLGCRSAGNEMNLGIQGIEEPSAAYNVNNLLSWLDTRASSPFFAYLHLFDLHPPFNFISYDLNEMNLGDEWSELAHFYQSLKRNGSASWQQHVRYALGIKYVDSQIQRLSDGLRQRGLLDNTILVLVSDHGTNHPGRPDRENVHVTSHYYDEYYRIPITFFQKNVAARKLQGLCSSIDVAPTLLELCGLPVPDEFQGTSLLQDGSRGREYVLMENLGPGWFNLGIKPMNVCVRDHKHKVVYVKSPDPNDSGYVRELYNLESDPQEMENLAATPRSKAAASHLIEVARDRCRAIY